MYLEVGLLDGSGKLLLSGGPQSIAQRAVGVHAIRDSGLRQATVLQVGSAVRIGADAGAHAGIHRGGRALRNGLAGDEVTQDLVEQTGIPQVGVNNSRMHRHRRSRSALQSVGQTFRKQQIRQLGLSVGLPALVRAPLGVVQVTWQHFAHIVGGRRQRHDTSRGIGGGEKLLLEKLSEIEVAKVVDTDLSLETIICEFFVGQSHDASIQHQEVQSGLSRQEIRRKSFDGGQGIQLKSFHDNVLCIHNIAAVSGLGDFGVNGGLAGFHRAAAHNHTCSSVCKCLCGLQSNTTVTSGDDGCLSSEILSLAKVLHHLLGCGVCSDSNRI
mmetsp:Transcript_34361/g.59100  ORF Transcript_34361/g.59100 Transcript_34361/m.59100 type:complete len:326 (-) Transcript_34361:39-1016(-)